MSIALLIVAGLVAAFFARKKIPRNPPAPLQIKASDFYTTSKGAYMLRPELWASSIAQQLAVRTAQPAAIIQNPNTGSPLRPCVLVSVPGPNALQWVADEVKGGNAVLVLLRIPDSLVSVPMREALEASRSKDLGIIANPDGLAEND